MLFPHVLLPLGLAAIAAHPCDSPSCSPLSPFHRTQVRPEWFPRLHVTPDQKALPGRRWLPPAATQSCPTLGGLLNAGSDLFHGTAGVRASIARSNFPGREAARDESLCCAQSVHRQRDKTLRVSSSFVQFVFDFSKRACTSTLTARPCVLFSNSSTYLAEIWSRSIAIESSLRWHSNSAARSVPRISASSPCCSRCSRVPYSSVVAPPQIVRFHRVFTALYLNTFARFRCALAMLFPNTVLVFRLTPLVGTISRTVNLLRKRRVAASPAPCLNPSYHRAIPAYD